MLRNLPERFSRADMLHLLDSKGFHGLYDFVYLPFDFDTLASLRYAFVNMVTPSDTEHLWEVFDGFSDWPSPCENVCALAWNEKQQGLPALLERYRNSPVMHGTVPDEAKPLILRDGEEVPFPAPTRLVNPPKLSKNQTRRALATSRSKGASGLSCEADAGDSPANNLLDLRRGDSDSQTNIRG
jgi:hypothetical protein